MQGPTANNMAIRIFNCRRIIRQAHQINRDGRRNNQSLDAPQLCSDAAINRIFDRLPVKPKQPTSRIDRCIDAAEFVSWF
eukprot:scaffold78040_cov49-Cyclotella_meneghiniana.AAC.6